MKQLIQLLMGSILGSIILSFFLVMVVGKTSAELRDGGITKTDRSVTLRRVDNFKERVVCRFFIHRSRKNKKLYSIQNTCGLSCNDKQVYYIVLYKSIL